MLLGVGAMKGFHALHTWGPGAKAAAAAAQSNHRSCAGNPPPCAPTVPTPAPRPTRGRAQGRRSCECRFCARPSGETPEPGRSWCAPPWTPGSLNPLRLRCAPPAPRAAAPRERGVSA